MSDELRRQTERLKALRAVVERELRARSPGVCGVGVGVRECRGTFTGELAFRVYVERKMQRVFVPAATVIPRRIFGYATDVHTVVRAKRQCKGSVRPLVAGVTINSDPSRAGSEQGTLGCFVQVPPDNHVAGLTCEHVLNTRSVDQMNNVFQPAVKRSIFGGDCNQIGVSVQGSGFAQVITFNNQPNFVDCALVNLSNVTYINKIVASGVGTSGGTPVTLPAGVAGSVQRNAQDQVVEIRDGSGNVVDTTRIVGSATALPNTLVWKMGGSTGLTVGLITDVAGIASFGDGPMRVSSAQNQILVSPIAGFRTTHADPLTDQPTTVETFTLGGDSGSAYMDLQNNVVGIHHHGVPTQSVGSHIEAVLFKLGGVSVLTDTGGSSHPTAAASNILAQALWADTSDVTDDFASVERELHRRFSASQMGERLLTLMQGNLPEILRLVWHRRAVTVAWHRHHGPAFVALFARALSRRGALFPNEAGGVTRKAALFAMSDVLASHGSGPLREAIAQARPWLLEPLANCQNLDDLCERLGELVA